MRAGTPSLRRRLLLLVLSGVALVWLLAALKTWLDARHEAEEIYDAHLAQSARVLGALLRHEVLEATQSQRDLLRARAELGEAGLTRYPGLAAMIAEYLRGEGEVTVLDFAQVPGHKYEARIALLSHRPDGKPLLRTPRAPPLERTPPGFSDVNLGPHRWRVFSLTEPDTGLYIQAAERLDVRGELVGDVTANALMPLLFALPLLSLLLWFAIGHALAPLGWLAAAVARRKPDALEPVDVAGAPQEALPLVVALNHLFERQSELMARERRFTADAAHELRTPLAALKLQAQVARAAVTEETRQHALARIIEGVDRATHLVEQLLALARADQAALTLMPLDLAAVARDAAQELAPWALAQGVSLECDCSPVQAVGDAPSLVSALRNLLDNAARYGASGGTVRVRTGMDAGAGWLEVSDRGPGIPAAQREQLLGRFRRGADVSQPGSGLGLSIVERIAQRHQARLLLEDAPGGGLAVRLQFPPA